MLASTNLAVRFLLELGALGAVGYWGAHTGNTTLTKIVLGAGLPLALAVVWGTFVAPKAGVHVSVAIEILLQVACSAAPLPLCTRCTGPTSPPHSAARLRSTRALMVAMGL